MTAVDDANSSALVVDTCVFVAVGLPRCVSHVPRRRRRRCARRGTARSPSEWRAASARVRRARFAAEAANDDARSSSWVGRRRRGPESGSAAAVAALMNGRTRIASPPPPGRRSCYGCQHLVGEAGGTCLAQRRTQRRQLGGARCLFIFFRKTCRFARILLMGGSEDSAYVIRHINAYFINELMRN